MVGHDTLYGILITDEFGYEIFDSILEIINKYKDKYTYPNWIASFPSAEEDQLVIGRSFGLSKHTNFEELESLWKELFETVPQDVKDFLSSTEDGYVGTDVHVVSGYF